MAVHPPSAIHHPRHILVRGVNWLGDAVMTTPALLRLRERFPNARITLLCPEKLEDLWLHHPAVNEVISFSSTEGVWRVSRKLRHGRGLEILRSAKGRFHASPVGVPPRFDLALVLPNSPRAALEVFLAGIPQRVGYARQWRNLFLTQAVASRPEAVKMRKRTVAEINQLVADGNCGEQKATSKSSAAHQLHEYLHLVAACGASREPLAPQLTVTSEEIEFVKSEFNLNGRSYSGPFFGLNPGAEYGSAKRWPAEKFIKAAIEIQRQTDCTWVVFGGRADKVLADTIERGIDSNVCNVAGQTSLRELMALLKTCRVLLTNDTGPMHIAAALGTPVVVPFGSTSPELTGPGLPGDPRHRLLKSNAPCAPCFLRECPIDFRCMNGISVERVVEAVLNALS
ncbi:MAG: lipopolysaccharide heptosyltransferase II [Verrucomicrobiota bacterium]